LLGPLLLVLLSLCSSVQRPNVVLERVAVCAGVVADGNVTLQSLTIFNTHEWFGSKPEVYFQCQGEDKVYLPDIQAKGQLYNFLGLESFQVAAMLT
jgi:hypothetical protein